MPCPHDKTVRIHASARTTRPSYIEPIYTQALTEHEHLLQRALDHHRAGRLGEASGLYQEILQSTPDDIDALYLLGAIAHQTGEPAHAVALMRRALAVAPDQARCYKILGLGLAALGKWTGRARSR